MAENIYLHRSIPLLFGVPSARASNQAIAISLLVMVGTVFAYALVDIVEGFPFFTFASILLAIHCLTALTTTGVNLLYIFRYMLVWILIFATACVYAIYQGTVYTSFLGFQYLTIENTRVLVLAGVVSVCGSLMGWHISLRQFRRARPTVFVLSENRKKQLRRAGYALAFGFSMLYLWKVGGIVGGNKAYAYVEEGFTLEFGAFNIFHFTGIALILLTGLMRNGIEKKYIFIVVISLIPGMMAGSRADFLPQAFIVLMLMANFKINQILASKNYWRLLAYLTGGALILALGYLAASFIALWRTGGIDVAGVIELMITSDKGSLIQEINNERVLFLETGNMMLGGLYSAIVQVREGFTGLLWGESYFNYLLIAPPAFLGLPRPLGLEWLTEINTQRMTLGGIFELAEAYWNFGLVGCFVVSFGLSYFFAWLLRRGVLRNNYFFLVWYFVFGIHGFRSIWYQNFSYFRLMTVMLVILGLSYLFFRWFSKDNTRSGQKASAPLAST